MKLASRYATACGLRLGDPYAREEFYPLPFDRWITVQTGSGQPAKNYDFFMEVLMLLIPILNKEKIGIVHLGVKEDPPLSRVYDLRAKTTPRQAYYLLGHALLHLGTDSWLAHAAGAFRMPLVELMGSTRASEHGPYWFDLPRTDVLESHRCGNIPTFMAQEPIKTVNLIPPEKAVESICKFLNLPFEDNRKSLYIGPFYNNAIFEIVPNTIPDPSFYPEQPLTLRLDYLFNEQAIARVANHRKIHIITNRPVSIDYLQTFKQNILGFNYEVSEQTSIEYVTQLRKLGIRVVLFTKETDDKKVANIRFELLSGGLVEKLTDPTKEEFLNGVAQYLNVDKKELDFSAEWDKLRYKSNKYLIANGKAYLSKADWLADKPVDTIGAVGKVIDSPEFWKDLQYMYVWKEI